MSKTNKKKYIIVYTDGSCSGNGKKNAIGGIGIHFPNGELKDVSKIFDKEYCTNQKTELFAILTAIRYIKQNLDLKKYKICIKTDSQYSIDCVTKWVYGWIKNGWKTKTGTAVANQEYIELIYKYYEAYDIVFHHVDAHTELDDDDSIANAIADKLATFATKKAQELNNLEFTDNNDENYYEKRPRKVSSRNNYNVNKNRSGSKSYGKSNSYRRNRKDLDSDIVVELIKITK